MWERLADVINWVCLFLFRSPHFSLQVFGQTPFYNVEKSQWSLWPEIPYDLVRFSNGKGLRAGERVRGTYLESLEMERKKVTRGWPWEKVYRERAEEVALRQGDSP